MSVETIYWDSNCFLSFLQADEGKVDKCEGTIQRAERGDVLIVTSALTLAEVLWMRRAPRLSKDKAVLVQRFFRRSFIRVYNVTRKLAEASQVLVWDCNIKPKDAIHVATAIHLTVSALETFDKKLIANSGTVGTPLLLIREPQATPQGRLNLGPPKNERLTSSERQVADGQPQRQEIERKVCPECGHVFRGNGWDGIDAHWRSNHEHIMPYEEAWPLLSSGQYSRR